LAQGRYRLEGQLRVQGVASEAGDPTGGAGLRISGGSMPPTLTGTTEWTTSTYDFSVEKKSAGIELVCELRASQGEAWFDRGSLKLTRLK